MEENQTISYYDKNAELYASSTVGCIIDRAIKEFLSGVKKGGLILDLGCGSGRDSKIFIQKGYEVDSTDGSEKMCLQAANYLGHSVRKMLFDELDEENKYDGIWACASLLHEKKSKLKEIFTRIARALKNDGVVYASFKYGEEEGFVGERYFTNLTEDGATELVKGTGLKIDRYWINEDQRLDRNITWLSLILKKD